MNSFFPGNLLLASTAFVLPTSSYKTEIPSLLFEVPWILVGTLFAGALTRIMKKWIMVRFREQKSVQNPYHSIFKFQMIPVLFLTAIGASVFIPHDIYRISQMLHGLSAGIAYTANLLLIKRYVNPKIRRNAIALSCAFRLVSGIVMPLIKEELDDPVYQGIILIAFALLSGALVTCFGMKKGPDRVWDEYYESYFERNSKFAEDNNSLINKIAYFFLILGMRVPGILLSNNVTKSIQLGFLESFSSAFSSRYYVTTLVFIVVLLMTAFKQPSITNPFSLKYKILPGSYVALLMLVVNIPLIFASVKYQGGFSLLAIILINLLLDIVFYAGLFYLLDTLLIQSNLSNIKISLILIIEFILITFLERFIGQFLFLITLEGYFAIISVVFLLPIFLYHKNLEK